MTDTPFEVKVYSKTLERLGWVGAPQVVSVTPRHNQQPTGQLTVAADDPVNALLMTPGARVVTHYRDEHAIGGPVRLRTAKGSGRARTMTYQVVDDWRILTGVLGWQVPGAALSGQGAAEYDVRSGPAESVVKGFLNANLPRLAAAFAVPVTVAPDLGRGDTVTVKSRMQPLADVLFPAVDQAGIGVQVRQSLTGLTVDCYEPATWPLELSEDGGTLAGLDWELREAEATQVVLGADGEGVARTYVGGYVATAAETALGYPIETFVDARDLDHTDAGFTADAAARANEALAAAAAAAGLSLELAETEVFRYGGPGVHVGDRLTIRLAPAVTITDVLRSATLTWTTREGPRVTPVVGERTDDPSVTLIRALEHVARRQRQQGV